MTVSIDILQTWMNSKEDEHLEFKEAKKNFHFEELVNYCVALANERGGRMILGVTDKLPRKVVGSQVFPDLEKTKAGLIDRVRLRIDPTKCRGQRRNGMNLDRVFLLCLTRYGDLSTSAMTCNTFSKDFLFGMCPLSTSAWCARLS